MCPQAVCSKIYMQCRLLWNGHIIQDLGLDFVNYMTKDLGSQHLKDLHLHQAARGQGPVWSLSGYCNL
ncbi:unnamed protein product [Urochloa humidicola]